MPKKVYIWQINASNVKIELIFYLITKLQEDGLCFDYCLSSYLPKIQCNNSLHSNLAHLYSDGLIYLTLCQEILNADISLILLGPKIHISNDFTNFHSISVYHPSFIRLIFNFFKFVNYSFLSFWDFKFCSDSYFGMCSIGKSNFIKLEAWERVFQAKNRWLEPFKKLSSQSQFQCFFSPDPYPTQKSSENSRYSHFFGGFLRIKEICRLIPKISSEIRDFSY